MLIKGWKTAKFLSGKFLLKYFFIKALILIIKHRACARFFITIYFSFLFVYAFVLDGCTSDKNQVLILIVCIIRLLKMALWRILMKNWSRLLARNGSERRKTMKMKMMLSLADCQRSDNVWVLLLS